MLSGHEIQNLMEKHSVVGLSITTLSNREVIESYSFGKNNIEEESIVKSNSVFSACSISKFATALLTLKLVEDNVLQLDVDVNDYLKHIKINPGITLRHLLSHTSGIKDSEDSFQTQSTDKRPKVIDLLNGDTIYHKGKIDYGYVLGEFNYSDLGYMLIEQIIEDTTNDSFEFLMSEYIFDPLEMNHSHYKEKNILYKNIEYAHGHNRNGNLLEDSLPIYPYHAAAGLWSTPRDLTELVLEVMNGLVGKSKVGISKHLFIQMITPQFNNSFSGLGVFINQEEGQVIFNSLGWGTGYQCMLSAKPYENEGIVIMTNTNQDVHQQDGIIGELINSLNY
jgi:CubicO group peptidase (beta-lactamase class C family)